MAEGARLERWLPAVFLLPLLGVYLYLLRPEIAGIFYDDGIYLLGAKALATGHGYHLLSEVGEPAIIKYPPLFSALLAPIWMLFPDFPANLPWFKGVNILLSLGTLGVLYAIGHRRFGLPPGLAAWYCLCLGLNFYWVNFTVEVFSEPLYLLLIALVLGWALRLDAGPAQKLPAAVLLGLVGGSVLAFYARTVGLSLMAGLFVWQWRRYGREQALLYLLGCLLACSGWLVWVLNHPPQVGVANHFYSIPYNLGYLDEFSYKVIQMRGLAPIAWDSVVALPLAVVRTVLPVTLSGSLNLESQLAAATWPARCLGLALVAMVVLPFLWRLRGIRSPLIWYAAFYLPVVILWPAHDQYPRLLMGALPFLGLAALARICHGQDADRRVKGMTALLILLCLSNLWPLYAMPRGDRMAKGIQGLLWRDTRAAFATIRTLPPGTRVWGRYNGMYPLYTGRQVINRNVIGAAAAYPPGSTLEQNRRRLYLALLGFMRAEHVEYLLLEPRVKGYWLHDLPDTGMYQFVQAFPQVFEPVYESPRRLVVLFRVHYEALAPATR